MESHEKFRKDVEYKISKHATRLGLSSPIEEMAKSLYEQFNTEKFAHSRSDDVFALSAIYLAHRVRGEPASTAELTAGTGLRDKDVHRAYRQMRDYLSDEYGIQITQFQPEEFIDKYANKLDVPDNVRSRAKEILDETEEVLMNKTNPTKAASSLYLASTLEDEPVRQKDLARVSGVTEVTIRNRYQEQEDTLSIGA